MSSDLDALRIRKALGRDVWGPPTPWGPNGWTYVAKDRSVVVISCSPIPPDGTEWVHASISHPDTDPTYAELQHLHQAVWGDRDGFAFQVFVPRALHVNIHDHALHLWGRLDGRQFIPDHLFDHGTV